MNSSTTTPGRAPRRGFTLIELTACAAMLVATTALVAELVGRMAIETRALDRRAAALREADNALERLVAAGPSAWKPAEAANEALSGPSRAILPGGSLAVEVGEETDGLTRLSVVVAWERKPGEPAAPVRLTTWGAAP